MKTAILLSVLLATSAHAATPTAKPRVQPVRTVSVRLMPAGTIPEAWRITTNTERSCTVQVDHVVDMQAAFIACMTTDPEREGCRNLSVRFMNQGKWDILKVRAVISPDGTWDKTGCDQSKVKKGGVK